MDYPTEEGGKPQFGPGTHVLQQFRENIIIASCGARFHILQSCFELRYLECTIIVLSGDFLMTKLPPFIPHLALVTYL